MFILTGLLFGGIGSSLALIISGLSIFFFGIFYASSMFEDPNPFNFFANVRKYAPRSLLIYNSFFMFWGGAFNFLFSFFCFTVFSNFVMTIFPSDNNSISISTPETFALLFAIFSAGIAAIISYFGSSITTKV